MKLEGENQMKFMTWGNTWRLLILVPMISVFSRIDCVTPFVEGKIGVSMILATLGSLLWATMVAYISWIRRDAIRKANEEEED